MKTQFKMLIALLLLVGLMFGIVGPFVGENWAAESQQKQYIVYMVVHGGIGDAYWQKVELGAKAANELYPDLKLNFVGPDIYNFEKFMGMLNAAIAAKPDGLICTITNPVAMDEILRSAIKKGLPVIGIDSGDNRAPDERIPYLSYIGEDSYLAGTLAAKEALKIFRPKRAIYSNQQPGAANIEARGRGFCDVLQKEGIPAEELDTTPDPIKGAEIMVSYIKRNPDTDLIFSSDVPHGNTVIVRLEDEGIKPGVDVKIINFDANILTLDYMKEDKIMFALDEEPYLQGYLSTVFMYLNLKYKFAPPEEVPTLGVFYKKDVDLIRDLVEKDIR